MTKVVLVVIKLQYFLTIRVAISVCVVFGPRPHYKNRVWLGRTAQVITMVLVMVLASKMVGAVASLAKLVSLGHW